MGLGRGWPWISAGPATRPWIRCHAGGMNRQPVALVGCALLALGVFAPAVNVPLTGFITYLDISIDRVASVGQIALAIAAAALIATILRCYTLLWVAGIAILLLEAWTYKQMDRRLEESLRMGWAWPVIAAGAIALLIAAAMRSSGKPDKFLAWMIDERGGSPKQESAEIADP